MCLLRKPKFVSTHFCLAVRLDLFWPLFFFWTLPRMVRWDLYQRRMSDTEKKQMTVC
jgi:hypothetical protein